jgi:hypothetical protein
MREQIIDRIKAKAFNGYRLSTELPYDESGTELFLKNPKSIYVDTDNIDHEPLFATLGGANFSSSITVVRVYFTTDAKNPPANYNSVVADLRSIRDEVVHPGAYRREALVSTSYQGDLLVTEVEYRLTRLN